ncbi:hypothetical protein [Actinomadura rubrisoli]|uniref:Glycosyltransferase family 2 protein n=1 Tax=Actinomadura rubrisoli TaxID=2530368 RepID=A0A4R5CJP9_9ACTN|nr:hypothetical protein [Actinomadura rubrisoli]TDD97624.1 hypothetical protein E1298_00915 [Actinomadura rubrisoli]
MTVPSPIPLLVLTNGRPDCITKTLRSAAEHLRGAAPMVILDDSGDDVYGRWLEDEFIGGPLDGHVLHLNNQERGYWRAMQAVWRYARYVFDYMGVDKAFFLEDDFTFNGDVHVDDLAGVLDAHPHLIQMALLRQPWFGNEVRLGGLIEALEAGGQEFTETTDGTHSWVEHRACFTGNPSLIPRRTFERDWPEGNWSESRFGRALFAAEPDAHGAYWGRRTDAPRVEHIGHERAGSDY